MKVMAAREFLRGGYRTLTEVTVVSNHGRPIFTVFPYQSGRLATGAGEIWNDASSTPTFSSITSSGRLYEMRTGEVGGQHTESLVHGNEAIGSPEDAGDED